MMVIGTGDVVAEYYQQQEEMLEGFNEMDALTDRGFLPGMSKVRVNQLYPLLRLKRANTSEGKC